MPNKSPRKCEVMPTWLKKYPIIAIEDGLADDDWDGWKCSRRTRVKSRSRDVCWHQHEALEKGIAGAWPIRFLYKVKQFGTLSESWTRVQCAKDAGYTSVVSHRSGKRR